MVQWFSPDCIVTSFSLINCVDFNLELLFSSQVMSNSLEPHELQHTSSAGVWFSVLHYLLEFAQIHVHWVSDAVSSSVAPFSCCLRSFPASVSCPVSQLIRKPKYWSFSFSISPSNEESVLISFKIDGLTSLQSKGLSRVFSRTTIQSINLLTLSLLYWSSS